MQSKNTDIIMAGIVNTYFQLASHFRCMKNRITSIALPQETAIMPAQALAGIVCLIDELPSQNETPVRTTRPPKTAIYVPKLA